MSQGAGSESSSTIRVVAVIGAGQAGQGFAMACAAAGFYVVLEDVMPSNLRRAEAEYADMSLRGGYGALELAANVEDAVREADVVVDFVPDELESKLEIFSMVDRMAPPKTILCTPSYALSITDLASCVYRPDRCVAMRGDATRGEMVQLLLPPAASKGTAATVSKFLGRLGAKVTVVADQDTAELTKNASSKPS